MTAPLSSTGVGLTTVTVDRAEIGWVVTDSRRGSADWLDPVRYDLVAQASAAYQPSAGFEGGSDGDDPEQRITLWRIFP